MSVQTTFAGEMQLAGWSESHSGGCKVVFWLPSSEDLEAFRALTVRKGNTAGHRFMAALVEVGDDERPVVQPEPAEKPKGGELAKLAGMLSRDFAFHDWLAHTDEDIGDDWPKWQAAEWAAHADTFIKAQCGIASKIELDHNAQAAALFHDRVRKPFVAWRNAG